MRILILGVIAAFMTVCNGVEAAENLPETKQPPLEATEPSQEESAPTLLENNEELIVAVYYRAKHQLSEGMIGYSLNGDIALPLEELLFLVEFAIQVDASGRKASGWFINENRLFSLNLDAGKVVSEGKSFTIDSHAAKVIDNQLYVSTRAISEWFPLDISSNLRALEVLITPREALSVDQYTERRNRSFGKVYKVRAQNPKQSTPYSIYSSPAFSVNVGAGYSSSSANKFNGSYTFRSEGDLAYMHSKMSVFGTDQGVSDARLSLSRKDPHGGILGNMNATALEIGDVSSYSVPLISGSVGGRGIRIVRNPSNYLGGQESITLDGVLEPGYDVELYRNNILIDAVYAGESTEYRFEEIELFKGQNEFRLEFYGPQGQRDTEVKRYYIGAGKLKKGELNYDISLSEPGKTTFGINKSDNQYKEDALSASVNVAYGVNSKMSVSSGLAVSPLANTDEVRKYVHGSLHTEFGGVYTQFTTALDDEGGSVIALNAATYLKGVNYSAVYEKYFNNFHSNKTANYDEDDDSGIDQRMGLNIDTTKNDLFNSSHVNMGLDLLHVKFNDGNALYQVNNRFTLNYRYFSLANQLSYRKLENSEDDAFDGSLNANFNVRDLHMYTQASYSFSPDTDLDRFTFGANHLFDSGYNVGLSYKQDYTNGSESLTANLSKEFKHVSLGFSASHENKEDGSTDQTLFMTLGFNRFKDAKTRKVDYRNNATIRSAARVTAYLDENRNNQLDEDEQRLQGIKVNGMGRHNKVKTDENGQALLYRHHVGDWIDVGLDSSSIQDPSLKPLTAGVSILPRGGVVSEVHLPVVTTADIEGTVSLLKAGAEEPMPLGNIEIQAVQINRETGEEIELGNTITAFDGFYALSQIPTGRTIIRVNPRQARRLLVTERYHHVVSLGKDGLSLLQQDFILSRKGLANE